MVLSVKQVTFHVWRILASVTDPCWALGSLFISFFIIIFFNYPLTWVLIRFSHIHALARVKMLCSVKTRCSSLFIPWTCVAEVSQVCNRGRDNAMVLPVVFFLKQL